MKELTQYFANKEIIFKEINEVLPKSLGSRKNIKIYDAIGIDNYYYAIFIIDSKSRFIKKNSEELHLLLDKLITQKEHNYKKKIALISSHLCSKAKELLISYGWSVKVDFM